MSCIQLCGSLDLLSILIRSCKSRINESQVQLHYQIHGRSRLIGRLSNNFPHALTETVIVAIGGETCSPCPCTKNAQNAALDGSDG